MRVTGHRTASAWPMLLALSMTGAVTAGGDVNPSDKRPTGETYEQILERLGDGVRENLVIRAEHDSRTDARKHKRFYADLQPLDDLPAYVPKQAVSGTIRVSGLYLHDGLIREQWIRAFEHFHPQAKVVITQKGTIASGAVDIETGPRISDRLRALGIRQATATPVRDRLGRGSYDVGWAQPS